MSGWGRLGKKAGGWMRKVKRRGLKNERGIALVLVLWVLTLLFIIVFEFCSTMRIEATIAKNFKEGERSYYFAQAGINRAIIELVKAASRVKKFEGSKKTLVDKEDRRGSDRYTDEEEPEKWLPREQPYTFAFDDGACEVTISDEGSKINLNWIAARAKSDRQVLADILERSCGLYDEERDVIVDSIIDWVDKDQEHLMNGAEDDYYLSLDDPYECRDGEFVILEELLLVRGVTEDIYYGRFRPEAEEEEQGRVGSRRRGRSAFATTASGDDVRGAGTYQGLSEIFTVFSKGGAIKININDAPFGLLMSLPAMTEEVAYDIIAMRREETFEDIRDSRLLELPIYDQIASQITVEPTNLYRIRARGQVADSSVARSISAVVEIAPRQKNNYTILYWQEGV